MGLNKQGFAQHTFNRVFALEAIYDQLKALYQVLSTDMAMSFEVTVLTNTDDGD